MKYIDMHCDTLMQAYVHKKEDICAVPEFMIDLERLTAGGAAAQFFAIFMLPAEDADRFGGRLPEDEDYIRALCEILRNTIKARPDRLAFAGSAADLARNRDEGKISAFLTLEDGRAVDGKLENLERFYGMGVRLISLTWNHANCLGFPNSPDRSLMEKSLTDFGREAVKRMNELGMLVDVSHLSDGGFRDVADIVKGPFVASHSNCRSLAAHPRNLTDEMIRTIAEHGGVAGLNFCPEFLEYPTKDLQSRISDMLHHLHHLVKVGGEEIAAIGSDLDGIRGNLEVGSPDRMHLLFEAMEKDGFSQTQIEKIAYKNVERVIAEVM